MMEVMPLKALCASAIQSDLDPPVLDTLLVAPVAKKTVGSKREMTALLPRLLFRHIFQPDNLYKWICTELCFEYFST